MSLPADTGASVADPDTFRILLATDTHLGYHEQHAGTADDSFDAMEEILALARANKVDFLLHGGDLFHDNNPSRHTMVRAVQMFRAGCLGDEAVQFQVLSHRDKQFGTEQFPHVNYEDPNYNVALPVFCVHGNHDDPAGTGQTSAVDLLSSSNLVNYYGKQEHADKIDIYPVLLKKGRTRLALYGLGHIRDERLHNTWRTPGKVRLHTPSQRTAEWFNIFTIHQNRVQRGSNAYIPEEWIPDSMDLVFWGHEHDCQLAEDGTPQYNPRQDFHVAQVGSSVATSLCKGEDGPKCVALLEVRFDKARGRPAMRMQRLPLKSIRPFIFEDIDIDQCVDELNGVDPSVLSEKQLEKWLVRRVDDAIVRAKQLPHCDTKKVPLIRLRIMHNMEITVAPQRFGQQCVLS